MSEQAVHTYAEALPRLILDMVEEHTKATGQRDSTIGRKALADSNFIANLRMGRTCTVDKLTRLERWLRENQGGN